MWLATAPSVRQISGHVSNNLNVFLLPPQKRFQWSLARTEEQVLELPYVQPISDK